jgi:flagellar biosynthesis protein FlhF
LTLIAAGRPEMVTRALSRREANAPVLIDAPGLDLLDPTQDGLQAELIAAAGACPVLVLPAGIDSTEAAEIAEAHASHGVRLMIPTRIDRTARLGGVLAACHGADLVLTEAGTGTGVADGLTRLTPVILASRLAAIVPPRENHSIRRDSPLRQAHPATTERNALSLHIAAQAGAQRLPLWKTNP